ncbi:MAG: UDP binding domain-containing protein, partial [Acidimicrobiia bacterium]
VKNAAGGDLNGRTVGLWGLAFKAGTDDVRESPATRIARLLIDQGALVQAFDPEASAPGILSTGSPLEAVDGADVLLIATEWPEFTAIDLGEVRTRMRGRTVVDARNLLDPATVRGAGLEYFGLGRS